jgi:hypothetical protein
MAGAISMTDIELYELLKAKIGEKEAKGVVEYFESVVERKFESRKETFATKEDIRAVREEIKNLEIKMEAMRSDIIRWMFLFWVGQFAALFAMLQLFFKP